MVGRSSASRGPSEAISTSAPNASRLSAHNSRRPEEPVSSPISISHLALKPSSPRSARTASSAARLMVCWPLLSAVPRPQKRPADSSSSQGSRPCCQLAFEAADDVAMAVAEHGRVQRVLDALGEQERPLRLGMGEDAAGKAQRIERRLHLFVDIAAQVGAALRILALRRDRDPAREIGLEGAAVEVAFGAGDGALPAHCAVAKIVHDVAIVRSRPFCSAATQLASAATIAAIIRRAPLPAPTGNALMCLKRGNLRDDSFAPNAMTPGTRWVAALAPGGPRHHR